MELRDILCRSRNWEGCILEELETATAGRKSNERLNCVFLLPPKLHFEFVLSSDLSCMVQLENDILEGLNISLLS